MILLRLLSWQYIRKHGLRSLLTLTGIVFGVAVFVAMHAANQSVFDAFQETINRIAGATELQVTAGESGFELSGEASGGQPEVEGRLGQAGDLRFVEDPAGIADPVTGGEGSFRGVHGPVVVERRSDRPGAKTLFIGSAHEASGEL